MWDIQKYDQILAISEKAINIKKTQKLIHSCITKEEEKVKEEETVLR